MDTKQILEDLDKHAAEFNFPVLDNAYLEFAVARLTAFRSIQDWLVTFEIVGFSTRQIEFVNDIYAYGSCIEKQGLIGEEIPISALPDHPLFDPETNACIADWNRWSINIGGEKKVFTPSRQEYADAGIFINREPGQGSLSEIELLRFLVHRLGPRPFLLKDRDLLLHFPRCNNLEKFIQTTQWQHPDVARQEKPSDSISIRSLIEALGQQNPSLFQRGSANTDWPLWIPKDEPTL